MLFGNIYDCEGNEMSYTLRLIHNFRVDIVVCICVFLLMLERKREKHPCEKHLLAASFIHPTGDQALSPGMCSDQQS